MRRTDEAYPPSWSSLFFYYELSHSVVDVEILFDELISSFLLIPATGIRN